MRTPSRILSGDAEKACPRSLMTRVAPRREGRNPSGELRRGELGLRLRGRHVHSSEEDEREDRADGGEDDERREGPVVARRKCLLGEVAGLGVRDEDRRRDGDAERTADLLTRVEQ